jgi:alpha-L-fucosidase
METRRTFFGKLTLAGGALAIGRPLRAAATTSPTDLPAHLKEFAGLYRQDPHKASLKWFTDARFGMMVHYGLTSVPGVHSFHQWRKRIPVEKYEKLVTHFAAVRFDAGAIAELAVAAGMKYVTFVAKHCDGFCLWDTKQTDFNSMRSPAKRDFVAELVKACNERGLGFFAFYEHGFEWHHPHGPRRKDFNTNLVEVPYPKPEPAYAQGKDYDLNKYLDYASDQVAELLTNYGPIAGIWLDGVAVPISAKDRGIFRCQELYDRIHALQPHALVSYKTGVTGTEDFKAPEAQQLTRIDFSRETRPVELCEALNPSWSYVKDEAHRNADWVWKRMAFCGEKRMNYLLCAGPIGDGSVQPGDAQTLQDIGRRLHERGWPNETLRDGR